MTRYQKYMQHIHSGAVAHDIEGAVAMLQQDIIDHLVNSGVKEHSAMIENIKALCLYTYKQINYKDDINSAVL